MLGIINKNLFFTLPDNIILERKSIKLKLSLKIYFYLFFLFRFFIFKESLFLFSSIISFIFDNIYLKKRYIQYNNLKYKKNYYIIIGVILRNKLNHKYFNIYNNIIIKDLRIYIYLILMSKKKYIYNYLFFYKNKLSIYLFKDFIFRIPFIFFIVFKSYIYKFKIYKYNEYINKISTLTNYPLIKLILRINWKIIKKEKSNSNINIFFIYKLYFDNFILTVVNSNKINLINSGSFILLLNKQKFLKFFCLFNNNIFHFIYNYFKIYFVNIFYLYIYNIWILQLYVLKGQDYIESHKWNIFYIFHLYWWLYKYNFDLPIWLYIIVILQVIKINLQNIYLQPNRIVSDYIINKNILYLSNRSLSIFKIISVIFIVHFEKIYFKFFKVANLRYHKISQFNWKNAWNSIIKYYPIDFIYLPLNYYNNIKYLIKYLTIYVYNLDILHWKLFYSGNILHYIINLNIINTLKYIKLNNYLEEQYQIFCDTLWSYYKKKENSLMNFLFFYNFNRDLFYKILINNYMIFNFKKIKLIIRLEIIYKNYLFKLIFKELLKKHNINFIYDYKELNKEIYNIFLEKYICIIICIIFIRKYIK